MQNQIRNAIKARTAMPPMTPPIMAPMGVDFLSLWEPIVAVGLNWDWFVTVEVDCVGVE